MSGKGLKRVEIDGSGLQISGSGWQCVAVHESGWEWMGEGLSG